MARLSVSSGTLAKEELSYSIEKEANVVHHDVACDTAVVGPTCRTCRYYQHLSALSRVALDDFSGSPQGRKQDRVQQALLGFASTLPMSALYRRRCSQA